MARISPGVSRDRVPDLAGRCDPTVERAIRDLYLRFYKFAAPVTNITQPVAAAPEVAKAKGVANAYTIVYTIDGLIGDGQKTPSFTVNQLRDGFAPLVASLTAEFAPSTDCKINFQLGGVNMLTSDLTLPAGQMGPVTTTGWALGGSVAVGKKIKMIINSGGGAGQVVGEIVMRKVVK